MVDIVKTAVIDSSVRIESCEGKLCPDSYIQSMDRNGISHAVIAPSDEFTAVHNREGNRQVMELITKHLDRFSGLAVSNPWYGKQAVKILEDAFEQGLAGLYLNPARQGFHLTEAIVDPLIKVCIKYEKPVYSHTGTPIFAMPFQLAELARRFQKARFVMGHCAWSDFWYDVIPAAQQTDNIIIEISCTTGNMVRNIIDALGADRVIFGSGFPKSLPENEVDKIRRMELSPEEYEKIMYENARKLWGIQK